MVAIRPQAWSGSRDGLVSACMSRTVLLIIVFAFVLTGCSGTPSADTLGADLYGVSCARCHGTDLNGGIGPALDAGSKTALVLTDEQIADVIRVGPGAMPGFGRLTDEQVDSLVDYLRQRQADG
jgi:cytochrome c5